MPLLHFPALASGVSMTPIPCVSSMTLCNALALLAFQSDALDFVKRLAVLVRLKSCWTTAQKKPKAKTMVTATRKNRRQALPSRQAKA